MSGRLKLGGFALIVVFGAAAPVRAVGPEALNSFTRVSWTERDGLPAAEIAAIAQDRNGYLWLGTGAGLVRFDGVRFVHWDALGGPALPSAAVTALCASRDGSLWLGFTHTPGLFQIHDGQMKTFGQQDGLAAGPITALLEDQEGVIWAGGPRGLARFRNQHWERLGPKDGLGEGSVDTVYEARHGDLWVGTSAGVFRRVAPSDAFQRVSTIPDFRAFVEDSAGRMWGTGRLNLLGSPDRPASKRLADGIWSSALGWRILADPQGNLWIATLAQGLIRVSGTEHRIRKHFQGHSELTSDVVLSLFQDREGNIWAGTQRGLERFSENVVIPVDAASAGITGLITSLTTGQDGSVWMGASDGLHHLTLSGWKRYDQRDGLPSVMVEALHDDGHGTIWAATDRGIAQFSNGRFAPLPGGESTRRVRAMTTDSRGGAWLADRNRGLFRWRNGTLVALDAPHAAEPKVPLSVYTDREGRVWAGFADGTLILDQDGKLETYSDQEGLAAGITAVYEDRKRALWIGTFNGLRRFEGGRFTPVGGSDRIFRSRVGAIIDDDDGYLWLGVRAGIVRVNPAEFESPTGESHGIRYTLYDASDGLRGDLVQVGYPGVASTPDGALWFVTRDGLAVVDPHRLNKRRLPPPVTIEGVTADQRQFEPTAQLRLAALTSNLRIDYTALSFAAPARVRFRYRLEGFDQGWIEAGGRRQAFYTNLPPRDYRFHVTAANDGIWNESGAVWEFSIRPTFYQTTWFYFASIVIFMLTAWAAWRVRVGQVRRRFSFVLAERARIAREIHDTLLQSLVGVAVQFKALSIEVESSPAAAGEHLTTLRRQIELYIREARRSIWDLRSPSLEGTDLAAALRQTAERIVSGSSLRFEFRVSGTWRDCPPRVEEQLLRIAQEAVSNVVRHAEATSVRVELTYSDGSVVLRIVDDGQGFDSDDRGSQVHWGLTIMNERAEIIGARLEVVSNPGRGTQVEVVVPRLSHADKKKGDGVRDWSGDDSLSTPEGVHNA